MRGEKYNKMDHSHFGQKVLRTKEMPNKNDAYDSPASARSSARSRSASTMANLRATCINDIHIRFLTCAAFHHFLLLFPLAASENSGGGGMARHRRLVAAVVVVVIAVVAVIGRVTIFTEISLFLCAQSLLTSSRGDSYGGICV